MVPAAGEAAVRGPGIIFPNGPGASHPDSLVGPVIAG
jgi:hypothetical protein